MDYFPPKTVNELNLGRPRKNTSRLGNFTIEEINNNYNNHFYWCSLSYAGSLWRYCVWGSRMIQESHFIYASEKEAATALDAYVTQMKIDLLTPHLQKMKDQCQRVQSLIDGLHDQAAQHATILT